MRRCALFVALLAAVVVTVAPAGAFPSPPAPGYWLVAGDGGVFGFNVPFFGSAASDPTRCPPNTVDRDHPHGQCFAIAATPTGRGYWILNGDKGKVYRYGDAGFYGEPATAWAGQPRDLVPTALAIVSTPSGHGYWVLELNASGAATIAPFGDAKSYGDSQTIVSHTHQALNGTPVGFASTPDGKGYWEVHSDGGVFGFGDAHFYGSVPGLNIQDTQPRIVGIAATLDGKGYWIVTDGGQVFPFGDATHTSDLSGIRLAKPIVGITTDASGPGFWLVAADGGVFGLGGAPFLGSMGGKRLHEPVFGITSRRFSIV